MAMLEKQVEVPTYATRSLRRWEIQQNRSEYTTVFKKFIISHSIAAVWMLCSIVLSIPWLKEFGSHVTLYAAIPIIAGISYFPGYINAFMVVSLLLDKQPRLKVLFPQDEITILIACYNEEKSIRTTIEYIKKQDYNGKMNVIVIDNNSKDDTFNEAQKAGVDLNIPVLVLREKKPGKHNALNSSLPFVHTEFVITLDADTLLHASAIRFIVARMKSAPSDVCAVAGAVLVRNSRKNFITRLQEWDYFLGIASIKRLQGLYQGTLVAQGAFSLYKTEAVIMVGGWPDAIGEDIVLTWRFLQMGMKVYFEPLSVAFTDAPITLWHFYRQRSRWARGMIEAIKVVRPWRQPMVYTRYLTGINLLMPYLDIVYTFCWLPGLAASFWGFFWIVGPATLFVLPLAIIQNYILYRFQKKVFSKLHLRIRNNILGYIVYILCYQMLMSPISVIGYLQELLRFRRVWK
jgi:biofilm PGA synthesis N-glycosyltransferase PgaC